MLPVPLLTALLCWHLPTGERQTCERSLSASVAVGSEPIDLVLVDLNADELPDLASANNFGDTVGVALASAVGGFTPALSHRAGDSPRAIAAGDLDGDGDIDLVTANGDSDDLSVFLNNGFGTLAPQVRYPAGRVPRGVAIADMNDDTFPDVCIVNGIDASLTIFPNDGTGTMGPPVTLPVGASPRDVVAYRAADGIARLATANAGDGTISVISSTPLGLERQDHPVGSNPQSIAAHDLNADGLDDLVLALASADAVCVLLADGFGGLHPAQRWPACDLPRTLAIVDLTADGHPDVVVACINSGSVAVLPGDGSGTLSPPCVAADIPDVWAVAAVQRPGERPLLAATGFETDLIRVLDTPAACAADLTGDGSIDSGDLVVFLELFLLASPAADLTADSTVDSGDLGAMILALINGCP
jgi:hypothetical protein